MKFRSVSRSALVALGFSLILSGAASARTKVGFVLFNAKEPRYTTTRDAAVDYLRNNGFDAEKVELVMTDGKGKKEGVEAAIKKLQAENVDVYVGLGTSAAVPLAQEIKDKPVVIGMVFDPIGSKIINDWNSSGNNVTGASNFVDVSTFMRRFIKRSEGTFTIKRVQVLYAPSEKNAQLQMQDVRSVEKDLGIQVTPVPLNSLADVNAWAKALKGNADLVFLTGSNIVGTHIAKIVDATIKARVPTATHLDDLVDRGALFGLVAQPVDVGHLTGQAIVKVLNGADPSSIPVQFPEPKLLINRKTQTAGGFTIPPAIQQWAQASGN